MTAALARMAATGNRNSNLNNRLYIALGMRWADPIVWQLVAYAMANLLPSTCVAERPAMPVSHIAWQP